MAKRNNDRPLVEIIDDYLTDTDGAGMVDAARARNLLLRAQATLRHQGRRVDELTNQVDDLNAEIYDLSDHGGD